MLAVDLRTLKVDRIVMECGRYSLPVNAPVAGQKYGLCR
jgi:hypothetical protein